MLRFLVSTYNRPELLERFISETLEQTSPDIEIWVLDEGNNKHVVDQFQDTRVIYKECDRFNDWGYTVKQNALKEIKDGWVCFPADDVQYDETFAEKMVDDEYEFVYCNWIWGDANRAKMSVQPRIGGIDIGGFVVKRSVFDTIEWNDNSQTSDGKLAELLVKKFPHKKVEEFLYTKW